MRLRMKVKNSGATYSSDRRYMLSMKVDSRSEQFITDLCSAIDNVVKVHFPDLTSSDSGRTPTKGMMMVREGRDA